MCRFAMWFVFGEGADLGGREVQGCGARQESVVVQVDGRVLGLEFLVRKGLLELEVWMGQDVDRNSEAGSLLL